MTRDRVSSIFIVASILLINACSYNSVSNRGNDSWEFLFDGHSLFGWTRIGGAANYHVDNGEIIGTTESESPNTFLTTNKKFGDFILEFEFNIDESMNSGVQFRSQIKPDGKRGILYGYQFELDPSERAWTAGVYDESRRGWLYPLTLNPDEKKRIRGDTWYSARIECEGNEIKTYLDGQLMAHIVDSDLIPKHGYIALQVHSIQKTDVPGKTIRWRNIRITEDVSTHRFKKKESIYIKDLRL